MFLAAFDTALGGNNPTCFLEAHSSALMIIGRLKIFSSVKYADLIYPLGCVQSRKGLSDV